MIVLAAITMLLSYAGMPALGAGESDYYEEPILGSGQYAQIAYMASNSSVLVLGIDGKKVFGDNPPQRLMNLEGATKDEYLRVSPGPHLFHLRVLRQALLGERTMSQVSELKADLAAGHVYYPLAKTTETGQPQVSAQFWLEDRAGGKSAVSAKAGSTKPDNLLARTEASPAKGSLLNKALLPPLKEELQGSNPVRVRNPNEFAVATGIRLGTKGRNFDVPANGVQTVYVPNGKYDIYFVYSDKPDALFQGDSFTLNDNGVEIQIVKVVNGNYGIRQVK